MEFSVREMLKQSKSPEHIAKFLEIDKVSRLGMNVYKTDVDGIKEGIIEWFLWYRGHCMIWYSKTLGWIATDCYATGYAVDGTPNKWRPSLEWNADNIDCPEMTEDDMCVVIYDCLDYRMCRSDVLLKCDDYADTHMTIRQQVINQKTPMVGFVGNTKLRDKIKNAFIKTRENVSMMFLDQDLKDKFETIDFNAPYNVESLYQYKKSIEAEMLEQIGIDYKDAFQKKERLVVDEQEGNDEMLNYLLADGLKAREVGIKKLKAKGLNGTTAIQELVRPIQEVEELGTSNDDTSDTEES